jgi:hypothetical protein
LAEICGSSVKQAQNLGETKILNATIDDANSFAIPNRFCGSHSTFLLKSSGCGQHKTPAPSFFFVLLLVLLISAPVSVAAAQTQQSYNDAEASTLQTTAEASGSELVEIDCSLSTVFNGLAPENMTNFGSAFPDGNFAPDQFGTRDGQFGDFGSFPLPSQELNGSSLFGGFSGGSLMQIGVSLMNESSYSDISSISGVVAVAPTLQVSENQNLTTTPNPQEQPAFNFYTVMGVPLSSSIIDVCPVLPTNITAGRNLQTADSGVAVVSERTSESLDAKIGDTITLFEQSFKVVGIYGAPSGLLNSGAVYMSLSDAQSISGNAGKISNLKVFADANVEDVSSVVNEIKTLHPELSVVTAQDFDAAPFSSPSPQPVQQTSPSEQEGASSSFDFIYVVIAAVAVVMIVASLVISRRHSHTKRHADAVGFSATDSGAANRSSFSYVSLFKCNVRLLSVNPLTNCFSKTSKF